MTPQPNEGHPLNACLARVIGLKHEIQDDGAVMRLDAGNEFTIFNPLRDPVEMEEVESWVQMYHKIEYAWDGESWHVKLDYGHFYKHDPDKKRAFAMAVWEMEQGNP